MDDRQTFLEIDKDELLSKTEELKNDGYYLIQICATKKDNFDLLYSFEKDYELINLRIAANESDEIQSISGLFFHAFLYENEMKDLFGLNIVNIVLDFQGTFYKTAIKTPFNIKDEEENHG